MPGNSTLNDVQSVLHIYREQQFTGVVRLSAGVESWRICFLLGRITWISSRKHGLRRWKRNLKLYSQALAKQIDKRPDLPNEAWNYSAINRLVKLKKIPSNQLANVVEGIVTENLFDILQVSTLRAKSSSFRLTHTSREKAITILPPIIINDSRAWREASQEWRDWHRAGLTAHSPDCGLAITDFESLRLRTSGQMLQVIRSCCGNSSLRDLALQLRQPILLLAQSIMPYVAESLIAFAEVPDLVRTVDHGFSPVLFASVSSELKPVEPRASEPRASEPRASESGVSESRASEISPNRPIIDRRARRTQPIEQRLEKSVNKLEEPTDKIEKLVAEVEPTKVEPATDVPAIVYIDDSPLDSRIMSTIVETLGCRYTNISDPIQALPMLIEIKPDLIFLDLVMPVANGYEVCAQIRRMSAFQKTPVIMMTSSDGVADRVRAKLVGASGFLGKPIKGPKVDKVLKKYLQWPTAAATSPKPVAPELAQTASEAPKLDALATKGTKKQEIETSVRHRVRDFLFSR